MNLQQVTLVMMAVSSGGGGTLETDPLNRNQLAIIPRSGLAKIIVEPGETGQGWQVRLVKHGRRVLEPPVYFPPVTTQEQLRETIEKAWAIHRQSGVPAPFLTRFLEPTTGLAAAEMAMLSRPLLTRFLNPPSSSPSRSASPPRRQRAVSPQTPPHPG
jgi:hypothetical protein